MGLGENATLIVIYVDDTRKITENTKLLSNRFEIKNLGAVKHRLGVEFEETNGRVTLHQHGYVNEVLARFGMSDCKPVATPVDPGTTLKKRKERVDEELQLPYRELVGALTYLASTTRPDISFAASSLGQFNSCFWREHWTAAKWVLRYLKDVDWGSCVDDRRSYTGYKFLLNGAPLPWEARKQRTVGLSITEAEYIALSDCVKEALHWQCYVRELGFDELADLIVLCDNRSSLRLAENSVLHNRIKQTDIRHHFVRDTLRDKKIEVDYVATENQVVDFFLRDSLS